MDRYAFCGFCGAKFAIGQPWPRVCAACANVTYRNPLPVAVLIVPVDLGGRVGVLAVRRAIAPRVGWLALPGGFIELGESWEEAAVREAREEMGVTLPAAAVRSFAVRSAPDVLIVFGQVEPLPQASLPPLLPTSEASEIVILTAPEELAFPLHTAALRDYLGRGARGELRGATPSEPRT